MEGDKTMNKKLFKQIRNEWRFNIWIFVELLIVSVVMWFITDYMYIQVNNYIEPHGFDISHCYLINMGKLTPNSHEYNPADTTDNDDRAELLNRLRHRPEIEAVSLSQNSYPYDGSNSSSIVRHDTIKVGNYDFILRRLVTPDFVRVFRYQGTNGETPEQLADLLSKDNILLSDNLFNKHKMPSLRQLVGKVFHISVDTTKNYILGASITPVRYDDFESNKYSYTCVAKLGKEHYKDMNELCVRVRDNMDHDFIENLWRDADKQLRIGNLYISDIQSFNNIRTSFERGSMNDVRNYTTGGVFLMLNIFLGILGTFWFRTQQRRGEIALFKALGSTNHDVFLRQISEGLILLSVATLFAIIIDFNLAFTNLNTSQDGTYLAPIRFIITVVISYLLTALMIIVGTWFPARKAMSIQPAEALHEE
ncbi:ABC-type antimicrobial peptide transport system, permease component [Xylanibacter oryzae DSM 17970]|uniref:ABC-type antimicrobial peptide transport system, permease component n=2 Tax=Xylanibacter oryzae TaxID=185293 RepID=A0ABP3BCT5_9BACT|nr:ABC-type antimicrobial peptide transport system, permease component [Xylanibacter oryzae DSM 17970]